MQNVRGWRDVACRLVPFGWLAALAVGSALVLASLLEAITEDARVQAKHEDQERSEEQARRAELRQLRFDVDEMRGVDECPLDEAAHGGAK